MQVKRQLIKQDRADVNNELSFQTKAFFQLVLRLNRGALVLSYCLRPRHVSLQSYNALMQIVLPSVR